MDEKLLQSRIKEILTEQIAMTGGAKKKRKARSKSATIKRGAGSKTSKKRTTKRKTVAKKKTQKGGTGATRWINWVKKYAREHNVAYGVALKRAGPSYRKHYGIKKGGAAVGGSKKGGVLLGGSKKKKITRRTTKKKGGVLLGGRKVKSPRPTSTIRKLLAQLKK